MARSRNSPLGNFPFLLVVLIVFGATTALADKKHPPVLSSAAAMTCLGRVDLDIVPPADGWMRWRAALQLPRGRRFVGYFSQRADKPVRMREPLAKVYPGPNVSLRQTGRDSFKLRKANAPDCDIEVIEYGIVIPADPANLYGSLIAPLVLAYDQQTGESEGTWGDRPEEPEVEDDSWVWDVLMNPVDSWTEINEVIAGNNNPWEGAEEGGSESGEGRDEDGDGFDDADTNKDGVVDVLEELSWMKNQVQGWFRQGGILGWL